MRSSLLVAIGLLLVAPASSLGAAQVALRPAAGVAGSSLVLKGSGFPALRRVVVKASGARARTLRASRHGAFAVRLTAPKRRGWVKVVSRSGRRHVVNRFRVLARGRAGGVTEVASSRGPRVRFSPTTIVQGGALRVHGAGYGRRARLRLHAFGATRKLRAGRDGRFDLKVAVPLTLRPGARTVTLVGGRVRFRVRVHVAARQPPPPPPAPPVSTTPPAIAGAAQSGQTLTASAGAWSGAAPITYAYAWERCTADGASCSALAGATAPTYTVVDADRGYRLRVVVTASNPAGSAAAASALTAVVTSTPGVSKAPSLPTTVRQGETVKVSSATFTSSGWQLTTQWQRCADTCVNIGANSTSYVVVAADVGFRLQVVQTATKSGATIQLTSNKTDPVLPAASPVGAAALWHMDDLGTTMVDSARSHNGTLHQVTPGVAGFVGTAFGFDGAGSYVTVPQANDLSAANNNVTLTIHMRTTQLPPTTVQDWDLIRSAGGYYDGDEYKMEYAPDGTAHCAFKGSGATGYKEVPSSPARPLNDGAWHAIQCVKTQTQVQTVVDGTVYAQPATIGAITITHGIIVGAHPNSAGNGSSEFYNGTLDEASIVFSAPGG